MASAYPQDSSEEHREESLRTAIVVQFVSCSLCLHEYKDPTDLPCRHTFCKECLKTHIADLTPGKEFSCPLCRKKTKVPDDKLEGFTHNFFIESLQDTVLNRGHADKKCNFCRFAYNTVTAATSKCITCHDYLCENCSPLHCGTTGSRNHRVLTFQQLCSGQYKKDIRDQQKIFCPEHKDETIRYVCSKCNIPICRDCRDLYHNGHELINLEKAAESVTPQLESRSNALQKVCENNLEHMQKTDGNLATLQENENSIEQVIKTRTEHLHHLVDQKEKELLQELHRTIGPHRENLKIFKEKCSINYDIINITTGVVKQILERGAPVDVLMLQQQFGQRLHDLQNKSQVDEIPDFMNITLRTNYDVDREISCGEGLGEILISKQPAMPQLKPQAECIQEFVTGCVTSGGISVSPSEEYVTVHSANKQVKVFSPDGKSKKNISKVSGTALKCPSDICHFPDGRMVLADKDNNKLFILSPQWEVQQTVEVNNPTGVALNNSCTKIAVAQDKRENSVSVFSIDIEGKITLTDVIKDRNGKPVFNGPLKVAYMSNECLVVADHSNPFTILILSPTGDQLYQYTVSNNMLAEPHGVCVDIFDNILVIDSINHSIHMVSPDGRFIQYIATEEEGLHKPCACAINQGGDLVVSEYDGKVKVFQYLEI